MKIKQVLAILLSAACMISCDEDTAELGSSLIPESEAISVQADSCFASSHTIAANDSLLILTSNCNLGRYTEPLMGASFQSGYLTQLNCLENYELADSVYGIGNHIFPDWFIEEVGDQDPYYANLRLYFTTFFGDSTNSIKIDVFELDRMIDANAYYYPNVDPAQFCDLDAEPLASISLSAWNYQDDDSLRYLNTYYPSISIRLPDELAERILNAYFSETGRAYFKDATSFMNNLCKGFYIRCSQGDGTILSIDQSILQINFKCIDTDKNGDPKMGSYMAEFNGNSEVLQLNSFSWSGLESRLKDDSFSWILSPFGLLTEITLPVDEMKKDGSVLNSAQMCLSSAVTESWAHKASVPPHLLLIRKNATQNFFNGNKNADNIESFVASYESKYGTFTYSNIAAMIERIYADREEWLKDNGMKADAAGLAAYSQACPNWDKVLLIPVTPKKDTTGNIMSYNLDINIHQVKLLGGPNGNPIKIKTVRSHF